MAQYGAINIGALLTASGISVAGTADIEVRRESDGALASIYSDEAGTSAIAQPGFQTDASGRAIFYTPGTNHGLKITITKGAESHIWRNVPCGTAGQLDAGTVGAQVLAAGTVAAARTAVGAAPGPLAGALSNLSLVLSVAANALTIALKDRSGANPSNSSPVTIPFRNATPATGDFTALDVAAASSLVISSGSTLGARANVPFRLWIVGFLDTSNTFRLGVINCVTSAAGAGAGSNVTAIYPLKGWGIASSTAEGGAGAADSAQVFYTGTAVASKPFVVLGYATWETGLATPGTWSAGPTRVQLFGPGVPLPGDVIQVQRTSTGAVATGTTTVPFDDTIPQSTEGDQYMTQAITPSSAANIVAVTAEGNFASSSASGHQTMALFQDATANALAAKTGYQAAADGIMALRVDHKVLAGTASATTFKVRAGFNAAGTTTFNGNAAARKFGGVEDSFIEVAELMG